MIAETAALTTYAKPNKALQPTPYSVRCAPAFRRG
jgi:hypothetical protein